ncbi:MAG: hypothetical protein ACTHJM_02660 [Marmoricola sp.]
MKRPIVLAVAGLSLAVLTLAGCGHTTGTGEKAVNAVPLTSTTGVTAEGGIVIKISVSKTSVNPTGGTASVGVGKPVTLLITSTVAGQIHVHSSPEQHIVFPVGISKATLTFNTPGTIEVEDHALDRQIVQIQVS